MTGVVCVEGTGERDVMVFFKLFIGMGRRSVILSVSERVMILLMMGK